MTISKSQLIGFVAADTGSTKDHTEKMLNAIFGHIGGHLFVGEDVRISGFGTFSLKKTPARTGRNPSTGATIAITAKVKPVFKPGADFLARLN